MRYSRRTTRCSVCKEAMPPESDKGPDGKYVCSGCFIPAPPHWACRNCGDMSTNRMYCPSCHLGMSMGVYEFESEVMI